VKPQATVPGGSRGLVGTDGRQLRAAKVERAEPPHINPRPLDKLTGKPPREAECKLAGYLKTGTEHLSPPAVRRIIQVVREGAEDSLDAVSQLDKEVCEFYESRPNKDPIKQMESVV
jgi:hypothetical protein